MTIFFSANSNNLIMSSRAKDILLNIISNLPPNDILNLNHVNKHMHSLLDDPQVWQFLILQHFPFLKDRQKDDYEKNPKKLFLEEYQRQLNILETYGCSAVNMLLLAALSGNLDKIEQESKYLNKQDLYVLYALAAANGHLEALDKSPRADSEKLALIFATRNGNLSAVKKLLARPDVISSPISVCEALQFAAQQGFIDIVQELLPTLQQLLANDNEDENESVVESIGAALNLAIYNNHLTIAQALLSVITSKASSEKIIIEQVKWHAALISLQKKRVDIAKEIIAHCEVEISSDKHFRDSKKSQAFDLAQKTRNASLMQTLAPHFGYELRIAVSKSNVNNIDKILHLAGSEISNEDKLEALCNAIRLKNAVLIKHLFPCIGKEVLEKALIVAKEEAEKTQKFGIQKLISAQLDLLLSNPSTQDGLTVDEPMEDRTLTENVSDPSNASLDRLPRDVKILIMSLVNPEDRTNVNQVNKHYHELADDPYIWKVMIQKHFPYLVQNQAEQYANNPKMLFLKEYQYYQQMLTNTAVMATKPQLLAALRGDIEKIEKFGGTIKEDEQGQLFIFAGFAIANGHLEVLKNITKSVECKCYALSLAARNGYLPAIEKILKHSTDKLLPCNEVVSAFQQAVQQGHHAVVQFFLAQTEYPLSSIDKGKALNVAVANGHYRIAEELLAQNTKEIAKDDMAKAFHFAVKRNSLSMIEKLLPFVDIKTLKEELKNAASSNRIALVRVLLSAPVPKEENLAQIAAVAAAEHGHNELLMEILPQVDAKSIQKIFNAAVENGHLDIVNALLLTHAASIDIGNGLLSSAPSAHLPMMFKLLSLLDKEYVPLAFISTVSKFHLPAVKAFTEQYGESISAETVFWSLYLASKDAKSKELHERYQELLPRMTKGYVQILLCGTKPYEDNPTLSDIRTIRMMLSSLDQEHICFAFAQAVATLNLPVVKALYEEHGEFFSADTVFWSLMYAITSRNSTLELKEALEFFKILQPKITQGYAKVFLSLFIREEGTVLSDIIKLLQEIIEKSEMKPEAITHQYAAQVKRKQVDSASAEQPPYANDVMEVDSEEETLNRPDNDKKRHKNKNG